MTIISNNLSPMTPEKHKKDIAQLKEFISSDTDLRIAELYFKEIIPKKENKFLTSPLVPVVLSAFFAIIGTAFGAWLQGKSNLELERQKYESSLVLKMLDTKDKKEAQSNLEFALRLGLIKDENLNWRISEAILDSQVNIIFSRPTGSIDKIDTDKLKADTYSYQRAVSSLKNMK